MYIFRSAVLILEIVSVFPYIQIQDWLDALCNRGVLIWQVDDLQGTVFADEPGIAGAKLSHGGCSEFCNKFLLGADIPVHGS